MSLKIKKLFKELRSNVSTRGKGEKTAAGATGDKRFSRCLKHLDALVQKREVVSRKQGDHEIASPTLHGVEKGTTRSLSPAMQAEHVFGVLKNGGTAALILAYREDFPTIAPWAENREILMEAAKESKVDLSEVARVFGLEDSETTVIAAE